MFWTSVRVSPCSALWRLSSLGRSTVKLPSSNLSFISGWRVRRSSPLGPFTATVLPWRSRFTPLGRVTGFLPIRDIAASYQTTARSSPPRFALRASRSVISPFGVETIAMPRPFLTRGSSRHFT